MVKIKGKAKTKPETVEDDDEDEVVETPKATAKKKSTKASAKTTAKTDDDGDDEKPKRKPPERPSFKFNVNTLADDLEIKPASVRVALRKHEIEKNEAGVYGWNSQKEYKEVLNQLKSE